MVENWQGPFKGDSNGIDDVTYWRWFPVEGDERYEVIASVYDDDDEAPDVIIYNPHRGYDSWGYDGASEDVEGLLVYAEELWEEMEGEYREMDEDCL